MESPANTILRATVGSKVYGTQVDQQNDTDEMGVCVEDPRHFFGLRPRFEQYSFRTQPEGACSGPGDLDLTIYSLAKFCRLALNGNPSILMLLFIPDEYILEIGSMGRELMSMRDMFISNNIYKPFIGYMDQQKKRMIEQRGVPKRPELVAKYGFDTKYAGHLIRLGYQGVELATCRRMTLPMREAERRRILDIRTGKVSQDDVLVEAEQLRDALIELERAQSLGDPQTEKIENFVINCYANYL